MLSLHHISSVEHYTSSAQTPDGRYCLAAMAKKTKAKAPASKTTAAKAKASSTKSSGAVVSVEACKS